MTDGLAGKLPVAVERGSSPVANHVAGYRSLATKICDTVNRLAQGRTGSVARFRSYATIEEKASGAKRDRPELTAALSFMRAGDTLVPVRVARRAVPQQVLQMEEIADGSFYCYITQHDYAKYYIVKLARTQPP